MRANNSAEIILSGAVIAVAAGFLLFTYVRTSGPALTDYELSVRMGHANGLKPGSDVRISGIKVGTVAELSFVQFKAQVRLRVHDDIRIPRDSSAAAVSGGVLDPGTVLSIEPGKSKDMLVPGAQMTPQP